MRLVLCLIATCLFCACASWFGPKPKIASDDRVGVVFTLATGVVRVQLLVGARCRARDEECPAGRPVPDLPVVIRTAIGDQALGTTQSDGGFDVPFARLDSLFPNQSSGTYQESAPLLIEGQVVSELPVAEIFRSVVRSAIEECDEALDDALLQPDYAQALLGRMLDLQLLGLSDERLRARIISLTQRVREQPKAMWSPPKPEPGDTAATDEMQGQIWLGDGRGPSRRQLGDALSWLPKLCTISVKGGEFAGDLLLTGAPGLALNVLEMAVGDVFSDWMIKSCCERLSKLANAPVPTGCHERRPVVTQRPPHDTLHLTDRQADDETVERF